jgi:hypothetical protein
MSGNGTEDEIMTVSEVATHFKISEVTTYKLDKKVKYRLLKLDAIFE